MALATILDNKEVNKISSKEQIVKVNGNFIDFTNIDDVMVYEHELRGIEWSYTIDVYKVGYDLEFRYNEDWSEEYEEPIYETYTIKDYFKTKTPPDIKIKAKYSTFDDNNVKEGIFNLKDIMAVNMDYYFTEKKLKITGTSCRDFIYGGLNNDTINAMDGNDIIIGDSGDDVIYGGNGDDHIYGDEGDDKLYGEAGNNKFYYDDRLGSLWHYDSISSGLGNDTIYSGKGNDTIVFVNKENLDSISLIAKKNDLLIENGVGNTITLPNYLKKPSACSVKNIEYNYYDEFGNIYDKTISLSELIKIKGVERNNAYTYKHVIDFTNFDGIVHDEQFGYGKELFGYKIGNDLEIRYNYDWSYEDEEGTYETYTIKDYFKTKTPSDIKIKANCYTYDDKGNEIIEEGIYNLKDILTLDLDYSETRKNLKITGTAYRDFIDGGYGNDTIKGMDGHDIIYGEDGNDVIYGGNGDDYIWGDAGNDKLYGEAGNNKFYFSKYDDCYSCIGGHDTIYSGKGNDTIVFENIESLDSISLISNKNDLILKYDKNSSITIANYLKNPSACSVKNIEYFYYDELGNRIDKTISLSEFITSHAKTITGTNYNDTIRGSLLGDIIIGGKGDDKLYGSKGTNTFVFNNGDGNDTLYYASGKNIIDLTNVKYESAEEIDIDTHVDAYTAYEKQGNDLILYYTENDSIRLSNYFKNGLNADIQIKRKNYDGEIETKDIKDIVHLWFYYDEAVKKQNITGTFLDDVIVGSNYGDTIHGKEGNDIIYGGNGDDKLYGETGYNKFVFDVGNGKDIIYSGKGEDTITFLSDISKDDIIVTKKGNNLVLQYTDNDSVTISNYLKNPNTSSVKYIEIADECISLQSFIQEKGYEMPVKINKGKEKEGSIIEGSRLDDTITGSQGNDTIQAGRGNDTIKGGSGNDIIYGSTGNDKLYGENGYNTLVFKKGDGNDTVYMGKGTDILIFDNNLKDSLTYEKSGKNLVIKYAENDSVTIANYFSTKIKSIDTIAFADYNNPNNYSNSLSISKDIIVNGYVWDYEVNYNGNSYNNIITATNNKKINYINANAGDDTIYCQAKMVYADGGSGDDTYIVSSLKNTTLIEEGYSSGNDILKIADKTKNVNIIFDVNSSGSASDLYIVNNSSLSKITRTKNIESVNNGINIGGYFGKNGSIERIETQNGYVTIDQINDVKYQVAAWLGKNGFSSVMDSFENKDISKNQMKELVAIYQNIDWQPCN